ncbi:hypothetical protein GCM10028816_14430 [Spirosoma lituiforme]
MTVLSIEAPHKMIQKSGLTISHSTLSFIQTASDKPAYLLLTITQQLVDTPVTFTMDDDSAYFQLASDSRPYYGPTLTVISPAQKFHVHVRFAADKRGLHTGQLTVQTPYESKTVSLEGRRKGWLPARIGASANMNQPRLESPKSASQSKGWLVIAILAGISGLGYVGYTHKCQLFPGLCQDEIPKPTLTKVSPTPLPDQSVIPSTSPKKKSKVKRRPEKAQEHLTQVIDSLTQLRQPLPADKSGTEQATGTSEEQPATTRATGRRRGTVKRTTDRSEGRTRTKPALTNEESELEKALNKPL